VRTVRIPVCLRASSFLAALAVPELPYMSMQLHWQLSIGCDCYAITGHGVCFLVQHTACPLVLAWPIQERGHLVPFCAS
jgi:hypothetical protein